MHNIIYKNQKGQISSIIEYFTPTMKNLQKVNLELLIGHSFCPLPQKEGQFCAF